MQAIRVTKTLDSETLFLPQLRPFLGQEVDIIVLQSARLEVVSSDCGPMPLSQELESQNGTPAGRRVTSGTGNWAALEDAANNLSDYDFAAWRELRNKSFIPVGEISSKSFTR